MNIGDKVRLISDERIEGKVQHIYYDGEDDLLVVIDLPYKIGRWWYGGDIQQERDHYISKFVARMNYLEVIQ